MAWLYVDMKRPLSSLALDDYNTLLRMGLLYEIYPEATGDWAKDTNQQLSIDDLTVPIHKVTLLVMSLNGDCDTEEDVRSALENLRHPEFVTVLGVETKRVEWSDDHPLNREETQGAAVKELFP